MAGTFYTMEAANLFCGTHDSSSRHLTLTELKLPDLQAIMADHHPGGSPFATEIDVGVQKLEPTFKLAGIDPELLSQFGIGATVRNMYTAYGVIRDQRTGAALEAKAIFEARLGKVAPDAFQKGELMGHEYALNSVIHYEFWFDKREKYFWDLFTNTWRIDGVDQNNEVNQILRVR